MHQGEVIIINVCVCVCSFRFSFSIILPIHIPSPFLNRSFSLGVNGSLYYCCKHFPQFNFTSNASFSLEISTYQEYKRQESSWVNCSFSYLFCKMWRRDGPTCLLEFLTHSPQNLDGFLSFNLNNTTYIGYLNLPS